MTWYEQWFDRDEYDLVYQNRDDSEAVRLVDLIVEVTDLQPGCSVLDVGCGRGRHALEFAERGYRVTGLDLSDRALEIARSRAVEAGAEVTFERGDMREPYRRSAFDLVVNLFTAFGYFESDSDHQSAVDAFAMAIRQTGTVVQDFMNSCSVVDSLVARDTRQVNGVEITQQRWVKGNRILKEITIDNGSESHSFLESVALFKLPDFERFYRAAGLRIMETYGDYDGSAWSRSSPRLIMVAKPESSI